MLFLTWNLITIGRKWKKSAYLFIEFEFKIKLTYLKRVKNKIKIIINSLINHKKYKISFFSFFFFLILQFLKHENLFLKLAGSNKTEIHTKKNSCLFHQGNILRQLYLRLHRVISCFQFPWWMDTWLFLVLFTPTQMMIKRQCRVEVCLLIDMWLL